MLDISLRDAVFMVIGFMFGCLMMSYHFSDSVSMATVEKIRQEAWLDGYKQIFIDNLPSPGIEKKITRNPNLKLKG